MNWKNYNLFALYSLSTFYFLSTNVQPWYVILLVFLSVFTRHRYAMVWSYTVFLSYYFYSQMPHKENVILIIIEYAVVGIFLIYELFQFYIVTNKINLVEEE